MDRTLLAYLFVCFSVLLTCMGMTVVLVLRTGSRVARAFLAFHVALSITVLAGLLIAFVDVLPSPVAPETRFVLEYLEAIVGFYGMWFTLPYFAHRVFAVQDDNRDRTLFLVAAVAAVVQHWTEYGLGGRWDARGDLFENLVFVAIVAYTLILGFSRRNAPGVHQPLANRFLAFSAIGVPGMLHDLFLLETTSVRIYPLWYSALSLVVAWTLYRHSDAPTEREIPPEWSLSARESEVVSLVLRGLSNKEVAAELNISSNTVKTHLRTIFDKSGCRSRFALMSLLTQGQRTREPSADSPES